MPKRTARKSGGFSETREKRLSDAMTTNVPKVGRNDPCPCGSGKKFKRCCLDARRVLHGEVRIAAAQRAADRSRSSLMAAALLASLR